MEKLKPLITHHFWILFLVTLCLPPVAWWMTSGDLTAEIQAREETLNGAFDGVSKGLDIPNTDWVQGVQQLIGIRKEQNRLALDRLWQAQMGLMNWPESVRQYMEMCPYRGELENQRIKEILPDLYRDDYQREVQRVWMLTEPVFDGSVRPAEGAPWKVYFPYKTGMPRVPDRKWELLPPTWPEVWNSQEDLWLLSELFKAVQRVNAPTTGIVDSHIKRVTLVELFGGERITDDDAGGEAPSGPGGAGSPAIPGMQPGMGEGYPGASGGVAGRGFGTGAAGSGTSIRTLPATFDLKEEFEVFAANAGPMRLGRGPSREQPKPGAGNTEGSDDSDPDDNRYLTNVAAYRTRGFRLQVTIHQLQVPELIRELLNSKYPIEIVRFQQMALNPDEPGAPGAASSGIPGMAGGGIPGSGGYPGNVPGSGAGKGSGVSDDAANAESGFDPTSFAGTEGTDTTGSRDTSSVSIQTALGELDLVDLVVVGELYLYNPPIVDADGDGVPDDESANPSAAAASTTDGSVQPETAVPGSTPLPEAAAPGTIPGIPGTTPAVPAATPAVPGAIPGAVPTATPGSIPSPPAATPAASPASAVPGTVPTGIPGTTPPAESAAVPAAAVTPPAATE
jgi:hypothetical protein